MAGSAGALDVTGTSSSPLRSRIVARRMYLRLAHGLHSLHAEDAHDAKGALAWRTGDGWAKGHRLAGSGCPCSVRRVVFDATRRSRGQGAGRVGRDVLVCSIAWGVIAWEERLDGGSDDTSPLRSFSFGCQSGDESCLSLTFEHDPTG